MSKKIAITPKPAPASRPNDVDSWVRHRGEAAVPMKRLTIDIPGDLHTRIKSQCALKGVKMADAIRELLEQNFPA